jgi:hypothetical protein
MFKFFSKFAKFGFAKILAKGKLGEVVDGG